jgi:hypothetical protein
MTTLRYQKSGTTEARAMDARERRELEWFLAALRPDGPDYLTELRGVEIPATPGMACKILSWGGRLLQSTYRPRAR